MRGGGGCNSRQLVSADSTDAEIQRPAFDAEVHAVRQSRCRTRNWHGAVIPDVDDPLVDSLGCVLRTVLPPGDPVTRQCRGDRTAPGRQASERRFDLKHCFGSRRTPLIESFGQDIRFAGRSLIKTPRTPPTTLRRTMPKSAMTTSRLAQTESAVWSQIPLAQ